MKKSLVILLSLLMVFLSVSCSAKKASTTGTTGKAYKVGFAFADLSNPVWAELVKEAKRYGATKGVTVTYVDAKNDSSTQISQIENFVQSGMNAIVICAVDASTLTDACKKAMDAGVKIVGYTQVLTDYNSEYVLNAYDVGYLCGQTAAAYINKNYSTAPTVEWGLMDLPQYPEIIIRANGIKDAVAKLAPNAKLVATAPALTTDDGVKNAENFLQAHANMKIICCIGGGGSAGGNEGIKETGRTAKDCALFGIDATEQEIKDIIAGDPEQASVTLGGGIEHGQKLIDISLLILNGATYDKTYYMPQSEVDSSNAQTYYDTTYGTK
jgi:ribose transport system substrate-binding protein